ncbi:Pimeloyl-ACP methyl ester carboxylesterase [Nonomuraea solani]|uniref:Pimeloyl-ACP methyl ester carboxylesterase n=1 Tax=Nonomuraea solani TaxID=1144553 RepID=A0A1H6ESK4_9ACTN|nr:alpha/beta hydrolase [Nonomuraea solani]SEG99809.1 Pimeloyl-ACP methyl ester carboxylesterase [Nonomuraea solani]
MESGHLVVPGARLYYEVRGGGPVLLLVPGGGGDAGVLDPLADELAGRFTVVAVDPRGYSRSHLDGPHEDQRVEVHSEDAHRLLERLTPPGEGAYVFGGSDGGIVALDLLARHPGRLRRVVAHEPPCVEVLPDAAAQRAFFGEVYAIYRAEGIGAAGAHMLAGIGGKMKELPDPATLPPRAAEMVARVTANIPLFMEHELRQFTSYRPDVAALSGVADRLVLAVGRESRGHLPYRPAAELAAQTGGELVEFPGGHGGYTEHPAEFAKVLVSVLERV